MWVVSKRRMVQTIVPLHGRVLGGMGLVEAFRLVAYEPIPLLVLFDVEGYTSFTGGPSGISLTLQPLASACDLFGIVDFENRGGQWVLSFFA